MVNVLTLLAALNLVGTEPPAVSWSLGVINPWYVTLRVTYQYSLPVV